MANAPVPQRILPILNAAGFAVVFGYVAYLALGTNVFGSLPFPQGCVDYHIIYDSSLKIVETGAYPDKHAYPPAAVALHWLLAQLPFTGSAALFLGLTIVAALACWAMLLRLVPDPTRPGWLLLVLPAFAVTQYYLLWDLRSQNCNLIVCACTLAGVLALHQGRDRACGFWIALSFSLKLFSVLLLPYLAWHRRWRACAWLGAFLVVFWLVIPWAVFGGPGLAAATRSWLGQMSNVGAERADLAHPILISLHNAAHLLFPTNARSAAWLVNGFRAAWLGLGLAALVLALRRPSPADAPALLAEVSLLLLAPAAVSPYLEPYHAIPAIIPSFLLADAMTDRRQSPRVRVFALIVLALLLLVRPSVVPFNYRGLTVNAALLLATGGALLIAALRRSPKPEPAPVPLQASLALP